MRGLLGRLLLALGATLLALGAAEAWFRGQEGTVIIPWEQPGRGFVTQPHAHGANAWGFLEREIPPGRDAGVRRVAVLGDSMTWGTGTAEQAWPRVAEAALGPPWQLLNFSHYGYDGANCAATLRHEAAKWAPDVVIYASYTNDLMPTTAITTGRLGYPVWVGERPPGGELLPGAWRRASAMARAIDGLWAVRTLRVKPSARHYEIQLQDLAAQARALGAPLVVFGLVPHVFAGQSCEAPPEFCDWHRAAVEAQARVVQGLGLAWIPAEPMLDASGQESFYPRNPQDHDHPGPDGHAALGLGFAQALQAALSPPPAPEGG